MKDELFNELLESVAEGAKIIKGKSKPSRIFNFGNDKIVKIRNKYGLSQQKFATLLGISAGTLRNWEQGRRKPMGSAKILMAIADKHPETLLDVVKDIKH